MNVFIPEPIGSSGIALLTQSCCCLAPWQADSEGDSADLLGIADAVIVRIFQMGAAEMDAAPRLKVIAKHGVGLDNVDLSAATERGIPVVWTPGSNANTVAEHTLALMLSLTRQLVPADRAVRDGWVVERSQFQGIELQGRTLGIVGLGRIGKRVALKASQGLGMRVLAYDPYVDRTDYPGPAVFCASLDGIIEQSDYLTLHVPLTSETRGMMSADRLKQLRPGCRLINTSRGAVVDELALADALGRQQLAGAALDVYQQEPLSIEHPLLSAPNVLLTPHIAGQSETAMQESARMAAEGVLDVLADRRPMHLANPDAYPSTD